jgi:glycosyltransferase involved in cell wall biosynthesis
MAMTRTTATIAICTRDRARLLEDCLVSILADRSHIEREVVVVDNASSDSTGAVVRRVAEQASIPVRLVQERSVGHSHARNAAVAAAEGGLLLFTDDDVLVDDGWADALAAPFADAEVGAAAGRILPLWPATPPPWLDGPHATLLTLTDHGETSRRLGEGEHPVGANMAVRLDIARAQAFDPALGHRGHRRNGYDEIRFMNGLRARHAIAYAADAVVRHRIEAERMSLDWMRAAFFDLGVGLARSERSEGKALPSLPRRAVRAARVCRGTRSRRLENERTERRGPETWEELHGYMWSGKHAEMLLGRIPALVDRVGGLLA